VRGSQHRKNFEALGGKLECSLMFDDGFVVAMEPAQIPAHEHVGAIVVWIDLDGFLQLAEGEIELSGVMLRHAEIEINAGGEGLDLTSPLD
jgi:hypothetical protein